MLPLLEVGLFEYVDRPNMVVFEGVTEEGEVVRGALGQKLYLLCLSGLAGDDSPTSTAWHEECRPGREGDRRDPDGGAGAGERMQFECWR